MIGCPVEAYTKDVITGVVIHSAETCIGCQYCTWNCSYGVPQYNPERGVVGKCDMCHDRLSDGMAPACVSACAEGAVRWSTGTRGQRRVRCRSWNGFRRAPGWRSTRVMRSCRFARRHYSDASQDGQPGQGVGGSRCGGAGNKTRASRPR
jgi:Fe-S-cluster-containing dehydrogenase component